MATGKLSTRQKMISMMYLVLLAIFALSVNVEVLDAFIRLQGRLKVAGEENQEKNLAFIDFMNQRIDEQVENEGKKENVGLRDTLSLIKQMTADLITELDSHMAEMIEIADWDEEENDYGRKDQTEDNYQYWLGNNEEANDLRGNGAAIGLRDQFNAYFKTFNQIFNSQVTDSLHRPTKQLQDPENNLAEGRKSWEQKTFEGPVVANMATLEAMKLEVWQEEKDLLDILSVRLGAPAPFQPDTIMPFSAPVSTIVPAGMPFQTHLLIGMSSKNLKPTFTSRQGRIALEQGGNMAMLTVQADGRNIPAGATEGVQRYTARIQVPLATGGFDTLEVNESFTVRKPELIFRSAAVQLLYRNCANPLNIDAPALGDYYKPTVRVSGGDAIASNSNRKKFTIVPRNNPCVIDVSSTSNGQTVQLGKVPYRVIKPPKPEVQFRINGRMSNGVGSYPAASRINVKIKPDTEFLQQFPRDARYEAKEIVVLLETGMGTPRQVKTINLAGKNLGNGVNITLPAAVRQAPRGSKVYVQLKEVKRINFRGQKEKEGRISPYESTLSFSIR
ncbi:MAG: GldM family protein [Bacteroidota bacterium]